MEDTKLSLLKVAEFLGCKTNKDVNKVIEKITVPPMVAQDWAKAKAEYDEYMKQTLDSVLKQIEHIRSNLK